MLFGFAAVVATFSSLLAFANAQVLQNDTSCRLATLIPFTDLRNGIPESHDKGDADYFGYGYGSWPDEKTLGKASFSLMAAAEMARRHFNDRNPVIVEELSSKEMQECKIKIPDNSLYLDSAYSRERTVAQLLKLLENTVKSGKDPETMLCAVVGPIEARANEGASVLTESFSIPQLAYATIDRRLDRSADFPTFRRVIPRAQDFASSIAEYVQRDIWKRDYVAIIYDASDYGEQFEDPLEDVEDELGYSTITEHIVEGDYETIDGSLQEAINEGYRTIILITDRPSFLDNVAVVAEKKNMLGDGYFWIISGDVLPPALTPHVKHEMDSPTDKLLRGAALFTNYDRFVYQNESDPFLQEWREQNASLIEQLNAMQPSKANGEVFYNATETYFQDENPTEYASFMYDAIMTAGISACKANIADGDCGNDHVKCVTKTSFTGASGPVSFYDEDDEEYKTSRNAKGVLFGMYNVRAGPVDENNMQRYEKVLTSVYSHDHEYELEKDGEILRGKGAWANVEGTEFLFFGGTSEEPEPKRTVENAHYLSKSIQTIGFVLVAIALLISVGSAAWVFKYRESKNVKAGQPEFMYLLCFGAALVASSLLFVSFDDNEDKGKSEKQLSRMCAAFPWFFVLGYLIMYCALFCKLWRISKLLKMRRRTVGIKQALLPFKVVITASVIILLVFQLVDPLQWQRRVINDDPLETYGECDNENGYLYYVVPLFVLFAVTMGMTAVVAWKMKDVQAELAESRWIFYGIFTHIQVWAVGIPIVIITDEVSKDAAYLMYAALCFVFSTSLVALVVWPKIFVWIQKTYFPNAKGKRSSVSIDQIGQTRVSGLLNHTTSSLSSSDAARVKELEKEVLTLKAKLREASIEESKEEEGEENVVLPESAPVS